MLTGSMTALVTPFRAGEIDRRALAALVERQIEAGTHALVPCGSTGESATLTHDEHVDIIGQVVRLARGRVPVIAGTGSNSTAEAIRLTRGAEEAGADGALLISPYYNRPTQEGIYRHYAAVAEATRLPIIAAGGRGAISVAGNVMPREFADLCTALLAGDLERGRKAMYHLLPLMRAMSLEVNPIPVKTALVMMGRCADEFRLPLTQATAATRAALEPVLRGYGLV